MGKIDCFSIHGCTCWFWSNDHSPPHFHVKRPGEWEIRVYFYEEPPYYEEVFVLTRISNRLLREILERATTCREELFKEWSEKVEQDDE